MGQKCIVLDTNILISAFGWRGKPREIFERVLNNEFELIISKKQLIEIRRVLNYPKFKFTEDQKQRFLDILGNAARIVETHNEIDVIKEDPADNMFLEAAIEYEAAFIVSGDPHLLKLGEFHDIKILTPAQFLESAIN